MAIVDINNLAKPVAVALSWHSLPGTTSERKEIDAIVRREGASFGCRLTDDDSGVTVLGITDDRREGIACGAAWLARASGGDPIVLVEPLGSGRLWLCGVRAGMPVPGLDMVIDLSQLHEKLHDLLRDVPDSRLCSTLDNLGTVYPNVVPQSFAELVAQTKQEKIKRIAGVNPALVAIAGAVIVGMGGWFGFDAYMVKVRQAEAQAQLNEIAADQKRRGDLLAAKLYQQHVAAGEAMLHDVVLDRPAVDGIVAAYMTELESKPLIVAGWNLIGYDCAQLACALSWQRGNSGTVLGFMKAAEGFGWQISQIGGDLAQSSHPVQASGRNAALESLDVDGAFRAALETRLQQAGSTGVKYELSKSEPLEKSLTPPAAPPGQPAPVMKPLPWKVGTVVVKGNRLFELRELPEYIVHAGLSVKNVRGDIKTNQWTMELNYATR